MKIPVFVSCPTDLNKPQEVAREMIVEELSRLGMEARALGRTDYPADYPLREILVLARHCSGGVILGFEQFSAKAGVWKRGVKGKESKQIVPVSFATPWNHLESGILFGLGLPLLVFKEDTISGGVFDAGVTDVFVHKMPMGNLLSKSKEGLREVILNWQRKVRTLYYGDQ